MGACPQAYAYANGNPLRFVDPDGRRPLLGAGTHFRSERDAAFAAANVAIWAITFRGSEGGLPNLNELNCAIYSFECGAGRHGDEFSYTAFAIGSANASGQQTSAPPPAPSGTKVVGVLHTHPSLPHQNRFGPGDIPAAETNYGSPVSAWLVTPEGGLLHHAPGAPYSNITSYSAAEVAGAAISPAH